MKSTQVLTKLVEAKEALEEVCKHPTELSIDEFHDVAWLAKAVGNLLQDMTKNGKNHTN